MDPQREAQRYFGGKVKAYQSSPSHGHREDLRRMLSLVGSGRRALDVATGGGHTAQALAASFGSVVAVDVTRPMLAALPLPGVVADAARLPFADRAFDAVACRIAAHHFPDLRAFVREAARVLAPGGRLYAFDLTTPERREAARWVDEVERLRDPSHVASWPASAWRSALAAARLDVSRLVRSESRVDLESWVARAEMPAEREAELRRRLARAPAEVEGYGPSPDGRMTLLRVEVLATRPP